MTLSDDRLAEIRNRAASGYFGDDFHQAVRDVHELLAEVEWLRKGGDFEAVMRQAGRRLKKKALIYLACCICAGFTWWACSQVLREPWALLASWVLDAPGGYVGGAVYFWCTDRWESRRR